MKRARLTHEVWMGFPNYEGTIQSISVIAKFCSKQRAKDYLKLLLEDHPYEDNYSARYGYRDAGDGFVEIAEKFDGTWFYLSSPVMMKEDADGYGYIEKGVIV